MVGGLSKDDIRGEAARVGLDLIGFAPESLIIICQRIPLEVVGNRDWREQQTGCGEVVCALLESGKRLVEWLRRRGIEAAAVPTHDIAEPALNTPAGQGARR